MLRYSLAIAHGRHFADAWVAEQIMKDADPGESRIGNQTAPLSRRCFLGQSVSTAGSVAIASALAGCATGPARRGATPKSEAEYVDRAAGLTHCGICKHFFSPDICEIVEGPVNPGGWCKFYALL